MLNKAYLFLCILCIYSCVQTKGKMESPSEVATNYCNCVEEQMKNAKDSSIDINDCEKEVFSKSRLMQIYMSFDNYDKYTHLTLDSARNFSREVGNITDTMCINKLDPKKIKKRPHIAM